MRKTLLILLILFFAGSIAAAQAVEYSESAAYQPREIEPKKPGKEKKSKKDSKQTNQSSDAAEEELKQRVESDVVVASKPLTIPVSVFDRDAKFVRDLKKSDFKIFVDGREQEISAFETNDEPLNIVLMIDTSPSVQIEEIQNYAFTVVEQFRPQDKFLVAAFNHELKILTELTADRQKINKAIRGLKFGNGTSLYDALRNVFQKQLDSIQGRKALILLTDGVDTTSLKARYDTSLLEAEKAGVPVFTVYLDTLQNSLKMSNGSLGRSPGYPYGLIFGRTARAVPPTVESMRAEYETGRQYLNDLVTLSGGRAIMAKNLSGNQKTISETVAEELRLQYRLTFQPSESKPNGTRAQIKVRVNRPNLTVLARGSHIAGAQAQSPTGK